VASGRQDVITKDELLDIGMKVIPHYSAYEGQLKNILFSAVEFKGYNVHYSFLDVVNIFHKYLIFESMRKHNSVNGALTVTQIMRAVDEHVGPAELSPSTSRKGCSTSSRPFICATPRRKSALTSRVSSL